MLSQKLHPRTPISVFRSTTGGSERESSPSLTTSYQSQVDPTFKLLSNSSQSRFIETTNIDNCKNNHTIETLEQNVKKYLSKADVGHDYQHVCRVRKWASIIASDIGADLYLTDIVALCHEIGDIKIDANICIEEFLALSSLDDIPRIAKLIRLISWSSGENITHLSDMELKIYYAVSDADRIEALGTIGIARIFVFCGKNNKPIFDNSTKPRYPLLKKEYKSERSHNGIVHFFEKVIFLPKSMKSEIGQKIGTERLDTMLIFLDNFAKEMDIRYESKFYKYVRPRIILNDNKVTIPYPVNIIDKDLCLKAFYNKFGNQSIIEFENQTLIIYPYMNITTFRSTEGGIVHGSIDIDKIQDWVDEFMPHPRKTWYTVE